MTDVQQTISPVDGSVYVKVGVKDSGRGCTLSRVGYESLTRPKSFHLRLSS